MPLLPASFGPMIIKLIMPKVVDKLMEMFKLDKVLKYVEMPNDADRLGEKNQEQINMLAGNMSVIENRLKKLEILGGKTKKIKSNGK